MGSFIHETFLAHENVKNIQYGPCTENVATLDELFHPFLEEIIIHLLTAAEVWGGG